jgi:hypothetical protein
MLVASSWVVIRAAGAFFDPGPLQGPDVGGVADHLVLFLVFLEPSGVFLDDQVMGVPFPKTFGDGMSHTAASDDEDRVRRQVADMIEGIHLVEGGQIFGGAYQHQGTGTIDEGVGPGDLEPPPFPDPHDADAEILPEVAFPQGFPHEGGSHGRDLGDNQLPETADDVGAAVAANGPCGQGAPQQFVDLQHPGAAGHGEDVVRIGRVRCGDDGDVVADLPDGEGNVGVDFVPVGGHNQGRLVGQHLAVRCGVVDVAHGNLQAHIEELLARR